MASSILHNLILGLIDDFGKFFPSGLQHLMEPKHAGVDSVSHEFDFLVEILVGYEWH